MFIAIVETREERFAIMIHRAGSLSQKYQIKIRSLGRSYVILLYTYPKVNADSGYRYFKKKSCITVNLLSTIPFLSHRGTRNRQVPSMEQINLVVITKGDRIGTFHTIMHPRNVMCNSNSNRFFDNHDNIMHIIVG